MLLLFSSLDDETSLNDILRRKETLQIHLESRSSKNKFINGNIARPSSAFPV